jgi:hypothetical protein
MFQHLHRVSTALRALCSSLRTPVLGNDSEVKDVCQTLLSKGFAYKTVLRQQEDSTMRSGVFCAVRANIISRTYIETRDET